MVKVGIFAHVLGSDTYTVPGYEFISKFKILSKKYDYIICVLVQAPDVSSLMVKVRNSPNCIVTVSFPC